MILWVVKLGKEPIEIQLHKIEHIQHVDRKLADYTEM